MPRILPGALYTSWQFHSSERYAKSVFAKILMDIDPDLIIISINSYFPLPFTLCNRNVSMKIRHRLREFSVANSRFP